MPKMSHKNYIEKVMNLLPTHVYWKDKNFIYLGCNDKQAETLGLKNPEEIVGKTDYDLAWTKSADEIRRIDKQVIDSGQPHVKEETVILPDGQQVTYLSTKKPIFDEKGYVVGIAGISVDITEKKQAEFELKRHLAEKSFALAIMVNELRNLFQVILLAKDEIKEAGLTNKQSDYLQQIENAISEHELMLACVSDYFKLEAGELDLGIETIDLLPMFKRVIESQYEKVASSSHVDFEIILEAQEQMSKVAVDYERFKNILYLNLKIFIDSVREGVIQVSYKIDNENLLISFVGHDQADFYQIVEKFKMNRDYKNLHNNRLLDYLYSKTCIEKMQGQYEISKIDDNTSKIAIALPIKEKNQIVPSASQIAFKALTVLGLFQDEVSAKYYSKFFDHLEIISNCQQLDLSKYKLYLIENDFFLKNREIFRSYFESNADKVFFIILKDRKPIIESLPKNVIMLNPPVFQENLIQAYFNPVATRKVMLVEDNAIARYVTCQTLESLNYEVILATSGEEAIKKFNDSFDFVLMDIGLPGMSGIEAAGKIKTQYPRVKLIAFTALSMSEDFDQISDAGYFDKIICKPVSKKDLARYLEEI